MSCPVPMKNGQNLNLDQKNVMTKADLQTIAASKDVFLMSADISWQT